MNMKDTDFIIAEAVLSQPEKFWTARDFIKINQKNVVKFFTQLIEVQIFKRNSSRGPNSAAALQNPEKLLVLCVEAFEPWYKTYSFICLSSPKTLYEKLNQTGIQWYLGDFDGLKPQLKLSSRSGTTLLIPGKSLFMSHSFLNFQFKMGLNRVSMGGNVYIHLPKYWRFLASSHQTISGIKIPSDFYSYLCLKNTNSPLAVTQISHMEKCLRKRAGSFLAWSNPKSAK